MRMYRKFFSFAFASTHCGHAIALDMDGIRWEPICQSSTVLYCQAVADRAEGANGSRGRNDVAKQSKGCPFHVW